MTNGFAHVELDNILNDIIFVNDSNPIRVFCTPVNLPDFNGVSVMNQSPKGFDLLEVHGGKSTGTIYYQLVVKPRTNYGAGRFYQAPGPAWVKADKEPLSAKALNQIKKGSIWHWPADYMTYNYNPEDMVAVGDLIPVGSHAGKIKLGNGKYADGKPASKAQLAVTK
jgi:hypothetical protein